MIGRVRARDAHQSYPGVRLFDQSPHVRRVKPADFLLFDQSQLNYALLTQLLGREYD